MAVPALLPLLPLAALGKPVASDTPEMLWSLSGPQGEGGKAPGCPGTEWARHTPSATQPPPLPLPPLQPGPKQRHTQHQTANANICHLGLPCEPAHLLQVFPKQGKRRRWESKPHSWEAPSLLLQFLASGSLGQGAGRRAGCQNSANCLRSAWVLRSGAARGLHPAMGKEAAGYLTLGYLTSALLLCAEEGSAFGGAP